ncbi:DDE_3 domain-containing protein [Trichonephila clavipes]|nr:DDE_3 domain-containing protein [Trichonephila clavipes]
MDWPAYSPDLNPIEHVWDMLSRRIEARQPPVYRNFGGHCLMSGRTEEAIRALGHHPGGKSFHDDDEIKDEVEKCGSDNRQLAIEEEKIARQHAIQQLRWESELNELRLEIESIRSNVKRTSCAEDRKKTSSNYRISIGRAEEHVRETSPAVLMAEATIPVTTPIKEEKGMDDLRVVYVKVKGEQEMVNAVIDTGAQMPVVRPDVVEGQSINNRGSIQITSAFGEHEMGEVKDSNMELNDFRHGVVPVSKNLVNDMLICSSDYEALIENSQMIRNPAKLREPSKKEGIISSTDSKSVCSQEVVTDLLPETQSLLNVPNGDLVAVKIKGSNVQTNGQGIKESKGEVVLTCGFKKGILYSTRRGCPVRNVFLILLTQPGCNVVVIQ